MILLLDECVDPGLADAIPHHRVVHVREIGLQSLQNGALLREADGRFEVLLTVDKNMPFQQSLKGLAISVVVFDLGSTAVGTLRGAIPRLEKVLASIRPGEFVVLSMQPQQPLVVEGDFSAPA